MRHFTPYIVTLLALAGLSTPLQAQSAEPDPVVEVDVDEVEQAPEPEPQLFEFETAGFSFDVMAPYEPVIRETSDGSIYSVTFQRRAADGGAFDTDGKMAFMRLTQTIAPLDAGVNQKNLLDATLRDAMKSLDNAYGVRRDRLFSDCSLEILGETREGQRIDAGMLPDGSIAYVECYAFEDSNGNGIGVTLKLSEPAGEDDFPEDVLLAEELLIGLRVKDLEPDSQYYLSFAGYPLRLPVGSIVQNLRQVNQYVYEATIGYPQANARVQLLKVPPEYNLKKTAADQITGYARTLEQQAQQGQLTLKRATPSYIPAGEKQDGVIEGMSFMLNTNNIDFYNTMHTVVDQGAVIAVSFTGAEDAADTVTGYVAHFFERPLGSVKQATQAIELDGYELELSSALHFVRQGDESGLNEYLVTPVPDQDWTQLVGAPAKGQGGYTRILVGQPSEELTLESSHNELWQRVLSGLDDAAESASQSTPVATTITLDDGRSVETLSTTASPEALQAAGGQGLKITSYLIPATAEQGAVVVSSVGNAGQFAETDLFTRIIVERLSHEQDEAVEDDE
ncbi:MAG: hypothetical protein ACF8MF_06965 [Phycisphaerales bacterium JB052]